MCGIAGFYGRDGAVRRAACRRMLEAMRHRGPDGLEVDRVDEVTLGHLRLAVIDLAPSGCQPMRSADGGHVITFNGEIYNYRELRAELDAEAAHPWRGSSDTEVLLACLVRWGVERTLARVDGMFAFALLERRSSRLVLARDRFGEKPLHYADDAAGLVFASELRGLEASDLLTLTLSREALDAQYRSGYVPAPLSVYRECRKLEPGCWLDWRPGRGARLHRYWSAAEAALSARARPFADEGGAVDALEAALAASVRRRLVADVPLGAFLSGGIDSSTVVALMQAASARPVETFSIGFDVPGFDESAPARAVARHLGTAHHERRVTADDALALVPRLGALADEPFADASLLPTRLVSEMARERVTVCLSGDGGDELFCGYKRYRGTVAMWRATRRLPARRAIAAALGAAPTPLLDASLRFLRPLADRHSLPGGRVGPKLKKLAGWLRSDSIGDFYLTSVGRDPASGSPVLGLAPAAGIEALAPPGLAPLEAMMFEDIVHYLPNDILTKLDRATMSVGLEGRVPMLEPGVFEVAWRLPVAMKQRGEVGKWALREVLARHVPRALIERPKMGFSAPVGAWLRTSLRDWASDLLAPERLRRQGLYDATRIETMLRDHLSGREERGDALWSVLMVQAWLDADPRRLARI